LSEVGDQALAAGVVCEILREVDGGGGDLEVCAVEVEGFRWERGGVGEVGVEEQDVRGAVAVGVGEHLVEVGGVNVVAAVKGVEEFVLGIEEERVVMRRVVEGEVGDELEVVGALAVGGEVVAVSY